MSAPRPVYLPIATEKADIIRREHNPRLDSDVAADNDNYRSQLVARSPTKGPAYPLNGGDDGSVTWGRTLKPGPFFCCRPPKFGADAQTRFRAVSFALRPKQHNSPRFDRHIDVAPRRDRLHRGATGDETLSAPGDMDLTEVALEHCLLDPD